MKSEYINPFVQGTVETFETMCDTKPVRNGKLSIKSGIYATTDLIAICGFSGWLKGAVVLSMTQKSGLEAVKSFTMGEIDKIDEDFTDAFGELINIIAGAAVAKLGTIDLCLPTVHLGEDLAMYSTSTSPWVVIPMKTEKWGEFFIEISAKEDEDYDKPIL